HTATGGQLKAGFECILYLIEHVADGWCPFALRPLDNPTTDIKPHVVTPRTSGLGRPASIEDHFAELRSMVPEEAQRAWQLPLYAARLAGSCLERGNLLPCHPQAGNFMAQVLRLCLRRRSPHYPALAGA